ncbi:MAG: GTPase domain-containing protein [Acidimicrobiia bacterium]|nr:GTPase domain-containing protein [Acidimicrobiia bacterium]
MQANATAIAALRPLLERLVELLREVELSLPTGDHEEAESAREAVIRTVTEYLIPRLDEPDAPVVAAVIGPSGTGKSTVVNSLANDRISDVGPLRPTTRNPVLWAHRDHGSRYWSEFVARVRERVGPTVEVVIGDDELTTELTVVDTPPTEHVGPSGRRAALDALALADLCVFVTSPSRYADISAWNFLREIRWRGVPMLFVLNRLPPDREEAVALLNDFASRLHKHGLLLEPDAAMVFGINEALGDRWHGGLDPAAVGALRNELGAVSNSGYRKTLVSTTAYTTGRNVVDRSRAITAEARRAAGIAAELDSAVTHSYRSESRAIAKMIKGGELSDMARHKSWSEAAVDLTAIITRRAGVAAQETSSLWTSDRTGSQLLEGEGTSLWRHTEDTSWDVQGRLEDWETTLSEVAIKKAPGRLRARAAKRIAARSWRLVIDSNAQPPWRVRRKFREGLSSFIAAAQDSLGNVVADALEFDARRFRNHLATDEALLLELERTIDSIAVLLLGDAPQLQAVPAAGDETAPPSEAAGAEEAAGAATNNELVEPSDA